MDLERFYIECEQILPEIERSDDSDRKERLGAIISRAIEHKQTLINLRKELLPLEGGTRQIDPQTLLQGDTTYKPDYIIEDETPRATIVSEFDNI